MRMYVLERGLRQQSRWAVLAAVLISACTTARANGGQGGAPKRAPSTAPDLSKAEIASRILEKSKLPVEQGTGECQLIARHSDFKTLGELAVWHRRRANAGKKVACVLAADDPKFWACTAEYEHDEPESEKEWTLLLKFRVHADGTISSFECFFAG